MEEAVDRQGANPYNPLAWFVGEPQIGPGTWIGPFCLIDGSGGLTIGAGCDISAGVHIYTHSSARRCVTGRSAEIERRAVVVGDRTFIGANAVVMMGVTIGSGCIIGAGAVVGADVPDGCVAVGVPARIAGTVSAETGRIQWYDDTGTASPATSGEDLAEGGGDPALV